MNQQYVARPLFPDSGDEYGAVADNITERTRRIDVLVQLDQVLSRAANRYDLAADMVRRGWTLGRDD